MMKRVILTLAAIIFLSLASFSFYFTQGWNKPTINPAPLVTLSNDTPMFVQLSSFVKQNWLKEIHKGYPQVENIGLGRAFLLSNSCLDSPLVLYSDYDIQFFTAEKKHISVAAFGGSSGYGMNILSIKKDGIKILYADNVRDILGTIPSKTNKECPDVVVQLSGSWFVRGGPNSETGIGVMTFINNHYEVIKWFDSAKEFITPENRELSSIIREK